MKQSVRLAPPYSVIFVMPEDGEPPTSFADGSVVATATGVGVGTLSELDGETTIYLCNDEDVEVSTAGLALAWQGSLPTTGRLEVTNAEGDVVLWTPSAARVQFAVHTNDPDEPDEIWIVVER